MRGGSLPKPDSIKIAQGTLRKCRQKKNQPVQSGMPRCPFAAKSIPGKKWHEIATGLKRLGLIDEIDATNLEALCRCYEQAKIADGMIKESGMVEMTGRGQCLSPWYKISAEAWRSVRMFCNDLGLNHLSRQRMESKGLTMQEEMESKYLG